MATKQNVSAGLPAWAEAELRRVHAEIHEVQQRAFARAEQRGDRSPDAASDLLLYSLLEHLAWGYALARMSHGRADPYIPDSDEMSHTLQEEVRPLALDLRARIRALIDGWMREGGR